MVNQKDQKEVFISYSTKNTELAQFLCGQLEGSGVPCWIAPRDIPSGKSWAHAIVDGLTEGKVMVFLVSEASIASDEVAKEIDLANGMKKIIFPVRIENVTLKGAALYHLNSKQWIDALEEDKFSRFKSTIDAVFQSLGKKSFRQNVKTGDTLDLFVSLIDELNQKNIQRLESINTMFRESRDGDNIVISLPLHIGASGIHLRFCYNISTKEMRIYPDAAFDGDPIKNPFVDFLNRHFQDLFGKIEKIPRARRWAFVELMPKTQLATRLTLSSAEICFKNFKENVLIFSERILPKLFDWIEYSSKVISAINRLEEELKKVFPETEGWRVGTPEGERLNGCLDGGKISIYKPDWQPRDNYKSRGLLSFAIQSDNYFLNDLAIGVMKYDNWMTLKHWESAISSEAEKLLGKPVEKSDWWIWKQYLGEDWRASGIAQGDYRWNDKFEDFIKHCVEKFQKLKNLEDLVATACSELPSLQHLDVNSDMDIPQEQLRDWESSLYVYNWMDRIAKNTRKIIQDKFANNDINVDFRYRGEWWTDIYLNFKVGKFDAAIRFICSKKQMITEAINLEPPDFETEIIKGFFKVNNISFAEIKVEKKFDGGTFLKWLERFESYVIEQTQIVFPVILALKKHLEGVVELTRQVEGELKHVLSPEDKWVIDNRASSLKKYDAISFWNKNWLFEGAEDSERPPLVIQFLPESPCFDNLMLVVKHLDHPIPAVERNLGAICGACDYAFGNGIKNHLDEIWKQSFDDFFRITGGSHFKDTTFIEGERRSALITHFQDIASKIKRIEPSIAEACKIQNQVNFKKELHGLIDDISAALSSEFPKDEGWELFEDVKSGINPNAGISVYKEQWKKDGINAMGGSAFSFRIQFSDNYQFNNLYFGLVKGNDKIKVTAQTDKELFDNVVNILGKGKPKQLWIYRCSLDDSFRYSANYLKNKSEFITHVKELFVKLKLKNVASVIDGIVSSESYTIE